MNRRTQTTKIFFIVLSLFVLGCILVSPKTTANPATAVGVTAMPPPTELANTATLSPTDVFTATATVYPPVFDPEALGDNRELDSFVLSRNITTTGAGGEVEEHQETIGFIKEPFNAYRLIAFSLSGWPGGVDVASVKKVYLIGGRFYTTNATVDWVVSLEAPQNEIDILQKEADSRAGYIGFWDVGPLSAQFVGQEDFQGIPANHFALV